MYIKVNYNALKLQVLLNGFAHSVCSSLGWELAGDILG
jgi:hypothetical protein